MCCILDMLYFYATINQRIRHTVLFCNITDAQIESPLPLITQRITFAPKSFPPPPVITARMEFPMITVSHRDFTPPLSTDLDPKAGSRHRATPRREKTPLSGQKRREHSVMFDDEMDTGPLSPLTESETEDDSVQNGKIKKPRGGPE